MANLRIYLGNLGTRSLRTSNGGWESIGIAFESLRSNKLRTLLTMLGVIIGVWSVISLLSLGTGAQQAITDQVRGIGTNLLSVLPGSRPRNNPRQYTGIPPSLTLDDAEAIKRSIPEVALVAPEYQKEAQIVAGSLNRSVQVLGVTPEYGLVRNVTPADGQFITEQALRSARAVAVLGSKLAVDLFGENDPINQPIRIKGQSFRVIGVLQSGGAIGGYDNAVLVPITTAHRSLFGGRADGAVGFQVTSISLQVEREEDIEFAQFEVERLMRQRHRLPASGTSDDFTVFNQATLLSTYNTITTTLTIFLGAIACISLVVGGIGVMNIMLVSVTERTREIGLRKAVGAKRRDILRQFLVEASAMSLLGGLIGVAIGYVTVVIIGLLFAEYITPVIRPWAVFLALGVSAVVGLFFGIYPAQRAARLDPIQALRFE